MTTMTMSVKSLALAMIAGLPAALPAMGQEKVPQPGVIEGAAARQLARARGLPERAEGPDGRVLEIARFVNDRPEYLATFSNVVAAQTINTDDVQAGGALGVNLTGSGVKLGIWDGGKVRHTHQELLPRAFIADGASALSDHATHVAGTMIAAGVNASARGMATQATLDSYDWTFDGWEMRGAAEKGLRASNHSYGKLRGWHKDTGNAFGKGAGAWIWWGDVGVSETEDYEFGWYNDVAKDWDDIAFMNPFYTVVKAAGNERSDTGPGVGGKHYYWSFGILWESSKTRQADGGTTGFDTVEGGAVAKNVITVGAVNDLPGGYNGPGSVTAASFTSFGPTDDGRIKPDLVANGVTLNSSRSGSNTAYGEKSGTSMATPCVTGSIGLILQHWRARFPGKADPRSSLVKALLVHTADEAGPNPGPDYRFGWGLVNTRNAVQLITDQSNGTQRFKQLFHTDNAPNEIKVKGDGSGKPLKVTIVWTDPAGKISPVKAVDFFHKALVNDLDLRVIRTSGGSATFFPWKLNPFSPASAATKGDNTVDTVEQVVIDNPGTHTYTIRITDKGTVQGVVQPFAVVFTGCVPQ